jgi:hypothetical protein
MRPSLASSTTAAFSSSSGITGRDTTRENGWSIGAELPQRLVLDDLAVSQLVVEQFQMSPRESSRFLMSGSTGI